MGLPRKVVELPIDWQLLQREAQDRGAYLLLMQLIKPRTVRVGALGTLQFDRGYYVYVGSAMKQLAARMARHLRRRKQMHWHVDYLRDVADTVRTVPVRSSQRLECAIAHGLGEVLAPGPGGFGCSDCSCRTHLYTSAKDPLHNPAFHRVLQSFRIVRA